MCQFAVKIPDAVLYDTHMTESQSEQLAKKIIAMHYYLHFHVSLGYCAQIADLSEEDFIKYLSENRISIFQFEDNKEFLEEMNNA
ncbi:MAG: UPF0175 family protein [Spirochaetaceae bacterium]|nr:UPF0175 family protein [Spirochaetaceae bacterium]